MKNFSFLFPLHNYFFFKIFSLGLSMRNETKEEGKEVQREEGMTTETTVITETVAQEEKIETKATPIEIIKDEKEEKTNHNSQENGGSEGLEKSDEIERRNTSESDDGLLALIASKSNEKDEDITEKVTRFLKEGVDSFSELLSFMKLGGSSTNLEKLVSSGKTACAICPTTEELSGYLLVLVISMIKDCNGGFFFFFFFFFLNFEKKKCQFQPFFLKKIN